MPQTMTTNLFERARRTGTALLLAVLCAFAGAALTACGPGTGGTGTGPIQGVFAFGGKLDANTAGPSDGAGAACVAACDAVALKLEDQRVEFSAACRRFVYAGGWAVNARGELVLDGTLQTVTAQGTVSAPARLRLQFSEPTPASMQVTAVLADVNGAALLGPVTLQSGLGGAGAAPACSAP